MTLLPLSFSDAISLGLHNVDDRSVENSSGHVSVSSGSSVSGLRRLTARIRSKPVPRYLSGSERRHAATDIHPTRIGRGIWQVQLLSNRSLRGMAAATSAFAIVMVVLVIVYAKDYAVRPNRSTSSVGGDTQLCKDVTNTITALYSSTGARP